MKEKKTIELKIKELTKKREGLYGKIKEDLTPWIKKSIKDAEKIKGYKNYWELYDELLNAFGLVFDDYERIIDELEKGKLIKKGWSAGIGGFLTTKIDTI